MGRRGITLLHRQRVKGLGDLIRQHGPTLARADAESIDVANAPDDFTIISRRAPDGSRFLFLLNDRRSKPIRGQLQLAIPGEDTLQLIVDYDLKPFGAAVLYLPPSATQESQGAWYPTPPPMQPQFVIFRPTIPITQIRIRQDPGPAQNYWAPLPPGAGIEDTGIFDRRFVWYRADLSAIPQDQPLRFSADLPDQDFFIAQLDGRRLDARRHGSRQVGGIIPPLSNAHTLLILYENGGRPNFGAGMEARCGLHDPTISTSLYFPIALEDWRLHEQNQRDWNYADLTGDPTQVDPRGMMTFRARFQLSADDLHSGDGLFSIQHIRGQATLRVNGIAFGRLKKKQNVAKALHVGTNEILISVVAADVAGGISGSAEINSAQRPPPLPVNWEIAGATQPWFDPNLDDSNWQTAAVGDPPPHAQTIPINPVWMRLHFPIPDHGAWKLHLKATGNGFLYLNGHPLGRYWEVGPQTDFFLPDCWLNVGPGTDNVASLCLRPTDGPVSLRQASIVPYRNLQH
jgi:hypothetical protein